MDTSYIVGLMLLYVLGMSLASYLGLKLTGIKAGKKLFVSLASVIIAFHILALIIVATIGVMAGTIILLIGPVLLGLLWIWALHKYRKVGVGRSLVSYIVVCLLISVGSIIFSAFFQMYRITGASMSDLYNDGDRVLTYKVGKKIDTNVVVIYAYELEGREFTTIGRITNTLADDKLVVSGDNTNIDTERVIERESIIAVVGPVISKAN